MQFSAPQKPAISSDKLPFFVTIRKITGRLE